MTKSLDFEDLVRRVKEERDPIAETQLFGYLSRLVAASLRRRTDDVALVSDLTQEALSTVFQKIMGDELQRPAAIGSFAISTGELKWLNHWRRLKAVPMEPQDIDAQFSCNPAESPLVRIRTAELQQTSRRLLAEIKNDTYRQILWLKYVQDKSKVEICEVLGIESRKYDNAHYRAKIEFRKLVAAELGRSGHKDSTDFLVVLAATLVVGSQDLFPPLLRVGEDAGHLLKGRAAGPPTVVLQREPAVAGPAGSHDVS